MTITEERLNSLAASFTQKELPESEVELVGEIPFEDIEPLREKALKHFQEEMELPGFRKGHVPTDMVAKKVGDIALLEEAVELFMRDFYPALVLSRNIDAVGRPNISITKLPSISDPDAQSGRGADRSVGFGITIRTTIYPSVALPKGWKELGRGVEVETVPDILDAEVDEALTSIRRARAKADDASSTANSEVEEEHLPTLDDEFAKSLGQFADLADLKAKLKENMKSEKEQKAKETRRGKIVEALLEKASVAIPNIFVESELDKIVGQMKEDVVRFGMAYEDYLKRSNKTEEAVREDFREQARKRAKLQLLLNKIAEEEKVEADKDAVDHEMTHALEHFPEARPDLLRVHIETVLRNEKVLQLLEGAN